MFITAYEKEILLKSLREYPNLIKHEQIELRFIKEMLVMEISYGNLRYCIPLLEMEFFEEFSNKERCETIVRELKRIEESHNNLRTNKYEIIMPPEKKIQLKEFMTKEEVIDLLGFIPESSFKTIDGVKLVSINKEEGKYHINIQALD